MTFEVDLFEANRREAFSYLNRKMENLITDYEYYQNGLKSISDEKWSEVVVKINALLETIDSLDKEKLK